MDIVVTIPKSEYENDEKETERFLSNPNDYEQFWTLSRIPKKLEVGDRVYFVRNNQIESSMRVDRINQNSVTTCEVTEREWAGVQLFLDDLRIESIDISVRGFQGFRYRWWK
ncbi:hypothetical protein ACFVS2_25440 [Brevibacillus sp. NPDC058079]|uniref:hypothetical protein n=1 Tax=Brevibacillus sp. NPDC058079 TaxID=3346330 RepID=UPI0036EE795E